MVITLKDIQNFSVLMFIFMFIYTLLGMEIYATNVRFYDDDISAAIADNDADYDGPFVTPRANFDFFLYALVVIFIVFIGEDWNSSMYDGYRAGGPGAYLYFISLFIIGNLILLNLFLAILLKNFEEPPGGDEDDEDLAEETSKKSSAKS
jgi:voltage-dependent calcium channel L type alpha-1D